MRKPIIFVLMFFFVFSLFPAAVLAADIDTVAVTAPKTTVAVGETLQATATLYYNDSTSQDITSQVTWQSQDESIATVTAGLITGQGEGTVLIDAIYTAPDSSIYSGQIQVTVIPAAVYDPKDTVLIVNGSNITGTASSFRWVYNVPGQTPADAEISLLCPCPVVLDNSKIFSVTTTAQDMDVIGVVDDVNPNLVHLKPVFSLYQDNYFSGLDRLSWPAGEITFSGFIFQDIKPASGTWSSDMTQVTVNLNFAGTDQEPNIIIAVPANNSSNFASANGVVGYNLGTPYHGPTSLSRDTVMVFFFKQPVIILDRSKITVQTTSPIGHFNGTMADTTSLGVPSYGAYSIGFHNVFAPGFFGPGMVNATTTFTFEPGSVQTVNGLTNTQPLTVTFDINPYQTGVVVNNPTPPVITNSPQVAGESWRKQNLGSYMYGPVKGDGVVYVAGDGLYCFADDGQLRWTEAGSFSNPVLLPNGTLAVIYRTDKNPNNGNRNFFLRGYNSDGSLRYETYIPGWVAGKLGFGGAWVDSWYFEESNYTLQESNGNLVVYATPIMCGGLQTLTRQYLVTYSGEGKLQNIVEDATRPTEDRPADLMGYTHITQSAAGGKYVHLISKVGDITLSPNDVEQYGVSSGNHPFRQGIEGLCLGESNDVYVLTEQQNLIKYTAIIPGSPVTPPTDPSVPPANDDPPTTPGSNEPVSPDPEPTQPPTAELVPAEENPLNLVKRDPSVFLARYLEFEVISEEITPFTADESEIIIKTGLTPEKLQELADKELQLRGYYWNARYNKWVALPSFPDGDGAVKVINPGYEGQIAVFAVKQPRFVDIQPTPSSELDIVNRLNGLALVEGYPGAGLDRPVGLDRNITNAEVITILARSLGVLPAGEQKMYSILSVPEATTMDHWSAPYVEAMQNAGIVGDIALDEPAVNVRRFLRNTFAVIREVEPDANFETVDTIVSGLTPSTMTRSEFMSIVLQMYVSLGW